MNKIVILLLIIGFVFIFYCYQNNILRIKFVLPKNEDTDITVDDDIDIDDLGSMSDLKSFDSKLD